VRERPAGWLPAAAWAAILFHLSSRPTLPVELASGLDKLAHFGAYAVLGVLLAVAALPRHPLYVPILLGFLYGAFDELHQSTVPGRRAEVGDWIADAAGTLVGVILFLYASRFLKTRSSRRREAVRVIST